jgi:hypothetical protein
MSSSVCIVILYMRMKEHYIFAGILGFPSPLCIYYIAAQTPRIATVPWDVSLEAISPFWSVFRLLLWVLTQGKMENMESVF